MKKVLKIAGFVFGALVLLVLCLVVWINFTALPTYESRSIPVSVPTDSAALALGQKVVQTECVICHMGADGKLSGAQFTKADNPFGEIWAANITRHPEKGLGRYSDGELAYLLRTGVKKDGIFAPFMMVPNMSDEHLGALIAYLRSDAPLVAASEADPPAPKYGFLAKALMKFGVYAPKIQEIKPVEAPELTDQVAYGKYLATAVFSCFECHSQSFETIDDYVPENTPGYFGGGNPVEDKSSNIVHSANITMSKDFGIGKWQEADFVRAVQTGQRPDGRVLNAMMPRYASLSEAEVAAIWAYLQTVPVLENDVQKLAKQ
ncbi:MAG: cytochrome c [Saprospiraceae bacterium]|nr:cytochrome c [Lewinellaceae bacterium]